MTSVRVLLYPAILLIVITLLSCGSGGAGDKTYRGQDFMPLDEGNYWVYEVSSELQTASGGGGVSEIAVFVNGTAVISGVEAVRLQDSLGNVQYLTSDAEGVRLHAEYDKASDTLFTYWPPFIIFPGTFNNGDTLRQTVTVTLTEIRHEGELNSAQRGVGIFSYSTTSTFSWDDILSMFSRLKGLFDEEKRSGIRVKVNRDDESSECSEYFSETSTAFQFYLSPEIILGAINGFGYGGFSLMCKSAETAALVTGGVVTEAVVSGDVLSSGDDDTPRDSGDDPSDGTDGGEGCLRAAGLTAYLEEFSLYVVKTSGLKGGVEDDSLIPRTYTSSGKGRVYFRNIGGSNDASECISAAADGPLAGALVTVTAITSDGNVRVQTANTDASGEFTLTDSFTMTGKGTYTVMITDIKADNVTYSPGDNALSSTITCLVEEYVTSCY